MIYHIHRWKAPIRVALFLLGAVLLLLSFNLAYGFLNTLDRLKVVEAERDQWQRPSDVIRALDLRPGNTVVDLGSGAGYFTLKLALVVGSEGKVAAVDLRKLSLLFLKVRALQLNEHAVQVIVGDRDDPHLRAASADSVLICNTYHEFGNRQLMLDHTFRALRPGGRLVIVDREERASGQHTGHDHEISAATVEEDLRRHGFDVITREDPFINRPEDDLWWLLVARKPDESTSAKDRSE